MRRIVIVGVFAALLFVALGQQAENPAGRVRQLAPGVFSRQGDRDRRQPANTSWVVFRDYVVVIDANTPWAIREILPEIRKTTDKPVRYVFDTHYHWDHTWGTACWWTPVSRWCARGIVRRSCSPRASGSGIGIRRKVSTV